MVDIELTPETIGVVVRFKRQAWSTLLKRHYMLTDLIIVIGEAYKADLLADFHIYREMEDVRQTQFIGQLRLSHYTGRMLSQDDVQPDAVRGQPCQWSSQMALI